MSNVRMDTRPVRPVRREVPLDTGGEDDRREPGDDLAPARGIVFALLLGVLIWAIVLVIWLR